MSIPAWAPSRGKRGAKSDQGKWAERMVREYLDLRDAADAHFAYHRYPDAKAARGALSAQPSDFLVSRLRSDNDKLTAHIEVKETNEARRLPKSNIGQIGKLRKFWWAGIEPIVLVYHTPHKHWLVLTAKELFPETDEVIKSYLLTELRPYSTAAEALDDIFA